MMVFLISERRTITNDNHSLRACVDKKNGFGWPRDFREEDF